MPAKFLVLTCANCSKEFQTNIWRTNAKYCSRQCLSGAKAKAGSVTVKCKTCDTEFTSQKNRKREFCSKTCSTKALAIARKKDLVDLNCQHCGAPFKAKAYQKDERRYCSLVCSNKSVGASNPKIKREFPCCTCGVAVLVARNVSPTHVHCEEHRSVHSSTRKRPCLNCGNEFAYRKRDQSYCSRLCAIKHIGQSNSDETRDCTCVGCGKPIKVLRATTHKRTRCDECRRLHRNKRNQVQRLRQKQIHAPAQPPYAFHMLTYMDFDFDSQTWLVSMIHTGSKAAKQIPLAKYNLEVKLGRLLRDGEEVVEWINGNKEDCSPSNLRLKSLPVTTQSTGFWTKPARELRA